MRSKISEIRLMKRLYAAVNKSPLPSPQVPPVVTEYLLNMPRLTADCEENSVNLRDTGFMPIVNNGLCQEWSIREPSAARGCLWDTGDPLQGTALAGAPRGVELRPQLEASPQAVREQRASRRQHRPPHGLPFPGTSACISWQALQVQSQQLSHGLRERTLGTSSTSGAAVKHKLLIYRSTSTTHSPRSLARRHPILSTKSEPRTARGRGSRAQAQRSLLFRWLLELGKA